MTSAAFHFGDVGTSASRLQYQLQRGDNAGAATLALTHLDEAQKDARLAHVVLLALVRSEYLEAALHVARAWHTKSMPTKLAEQVIRILLDAGQAEEALTTARSAVAAHPSIARLHFMLAQALLLHDETAHAEEALTQLAQAHACDPQDLPVLALYGEQLLQAGRYTEAVTILEGATQKAPHLQNIQHLRARALKHAGRYEEASEAALLASRTGKHEQSKRNAVSALLLAGRQEEAQDIYRDLLASRGAKLAATLEENLNMLPARAHESRVPATRLEWAWKLATLAHGTAPTQPREFWNNAARMGNLADILLMDWLECHTDRYGELVARLDGLPQVEATCTEALSEGKGALFATAHIGPMFAGPLALHYLGMPHKWLSSTPSISTATYADSLISTSDQSESQVAQRIRESLRGGKIVIVAVDGAMSPLAPRVMWQGVSVTYSDFTATLAYRNKSPSFFVAPYWTEGWRIGFALERMPAPAADESLRDYIVRWREAFFEGVLRQVARGPESMRLAGGIWRHV